MRNLVVVAFCALSTAASIEACSGTDGGAPNLGGAAGEGGVGGSGGKGGSGGTALGGMAGAGTGATSAGGVGMGGTMTGDEVLDALAALGVDVENTPRLGDDSQPLPEDYAPLGASQSFDTIEELMLLGVPFTGADSLFTLYELQSQNDRPIYGKENYFAPALSDTPWAQSVGSTPAALRVAAAADIDGDGLDEVAVLFRDSTEGVTRLITFQETDKGGVISFKQEQELDVSDKVATSLSLQAGDLNGDGLAEFAVGLSMDTGAELRFLKNEGGALSLDSVTKKLPQVSPTSRIDLSMAAGNLDDDSAQELVVVVNELTQSVDGEKGTSRYYVIDDAKADYADVADGPIRASLASINRTAVVADVAVGDMDGDQVDEIVFAGLQSFDPSGSCGYRYLMVELDDLRHDVAVLAAHEEVPGEQGPNIPPDCAAYDPGELRYVHVNILDLNGDGLPEVQANQYVFHDFVGHQPFSQYQWGVDGDDNPQLATIDDASLFASGTRFDAETSTMVVGDVTADGRQNIIFYSQATNALETWGLSNPDDGTAPLTDPIFANDWRKMNALEVEAPGIEPIRPQLLPSNINHDSLAVRFSDGTYRLVFTEPIVLAALAAPPCALDLGQESDACRTTFGTTTSTTISKEEVYSVNASVTVGFEFEFAALGVKTIGLEVLGTVSAEASKSTSSAYTVSKSIAYTTGALEDTVILTTVPLDQYTYEVTSHPDPELIGSKIVISLPREPIDVQVERERYNANVVTGGPVIDERLFAHAPGDPKSYPNSSEKDALLKEFPGFETGPAAVGNSGGGTELAINVASETGTGESYGASFELSVQGSAGGFVAGFTVGGSKENSLQIVHGTESSYSGFVSDMDVSTADFGKTRYSWGMFTYVFDDAASGQQYEVINYWVK